MTPPKAGAALGAVVRAPRAVLREAERRLARSLTLGAVAHAPGAMLRAPTRFRSIRTKLLLGFGVLLALGALNIGVYYVGARQRQRVFGELREAMDRQTLITRVSNRLEDQKRFVDVALVAAGGEELPMPTADERRRFALSVDSIPKLLDSMLALVPKPAQRDSLLELRGKARTLAVAWKRYYETPAADPGKVLAQIEAEPLAQELLSADLPRIAEAERNRLARARERFVRSDRTSSRVTWFSFVLSALLGGLLAVIISRDVLRAIGALKSGVTKIGAGDLDHRIPILTRDELGDVAATFNDMMARLQQRQQEIEAQRQVSESLLLNILPRQIADELSEKGKVDAKYYADATILFADFVGFTKLSEGLSVDHMVRLLDQVFTEFDYIVRDYRLEKLKTIGDAYLCVGGLTREGSSHPIDAVLAAFAMVHAVEERAAEEGLPLAVRVGIHTGPVAAGVVGIEKFAFDVWGDTVNFASRLEAASEPNRINISSGTYLRVKDFFDCEYRGQIETKEERAFDMYFVTGLHPELHGAGCPPPGFAERYQIYFERPPVSFPPVLQRA